MAMEIKVSIPRDHLWWWRTWVSVLGLCSSSLAGLHRSESRNTGKDNVLGTTQAHIFHHCHLLWDLCSKLVQQKMCVFLFLSGWTSSVRWNRWQPSACTLPLYVPSSRHIFGRRAGVWSQPTPHCTRSPLTFRPHCILFSSSCLGWVLAAPAAIRGAISGKQLILGESSYRPAIAVRHVKCLPDGDA